MLSVLPGPLSRLQLDATETREVVTSHQLLCLMSARVLDPFQSINLPGQAACARILLHLALFPHSQAAHALDCLYFIMLPFNCPISNTRFQG